MIVEDVDIEIKKFKMYAEKADSEKKIVDLCKKYLKHKGIDVDGTIDEAMKSALAAATQPPKVEQRYVGIPDLIRCQAKVVIDDRHDHGANAFDYRMHLKKQLAELIMHEVIKSDAIVFEQAKDPANWQDVIYASLSIYRDPRYAQFKR